jgi:hypothetical protein
MREPGAKVGGRVERSTNKVGSVDTISKTVAGIEQFLRYVAPGFVAIAFCLWAYPAGSEVGGLSLLSGSGETLLVGIVLGVLLNSLHVAVFEDLFCLLVYSAHRFRPLNARLPESLRSKGVRDIWRELEDRRLARRFANDGRESRFQKSHDGLGATLTFLYCSSYPALAICAYQLVTCTTLNCAVLGAGLGLLVAGFICDVRYTELDAYGFEKYEVNS